MNLTFLLSFEKTHFERDHCCSQKKKVDALPSRFKGHIKKNISSLCAPWQVQHEPFKQGTLDEPLFKAGGSK